jgi:GNAT superfamily N-acetyltransferase
MTVQTETASDLLVRDATVDDADECGRIFFDAFESIAGRHSFPTEPASPEFTRFMVGRMLETDRIAAFAAELDGAVVGSLFVDERSPIAGIGPVTVDPSTQDAGIGRALMEVALRRERERGAAGVRLVQTAYHYRSFALYAKLGFVVREPLAVLQGAPPSTAVPGRGTRPAQLDDLPACDDLCMRINGHDRHGELRDAIEAGTAVVIESPQRITGYATGFGYGWHAVAESDEDLIALIGSADQLWAWGSSSPRGTPPCSAGVSTADCGSSRRRR